MSQPEFFRTFSIDVPWPEVGAGRCVRGAQRHYKLLDKPGCRTVPDALRVITSCPLWRPADDAHLWSWTTDNYLIAGLWLIEQLGFRYIRTFPWVKTKKDGATDLDELEEEDLHSGIGQYGRGQHELLLFAVRGKGMSSDVYQDRRDVGSVIVAPHERDERGKIIHSRKPIASYEKIEARSKGPYAEIFSRRGRPGWSSWGNEFQSEGVEFDPLAGWTEHPQDKRYVYRGDEVKLKSEIEAECAGGKQ